MRGKRVLSIMPKGGKDSMMAVPQGWQQALSEHLIVGNDCGRGDGAEALIEQDPNGTFIVETKYTNDHFQTTDPCIVDRVLEEFNIPKAGWQ
jgi:hypothetical protein